jgi:tetratricopeptide (TPR) repeat protein
MLTPDNTTSVEPSRPSLRSRLKPFFLFLAILFAVVIVAGITGYFSGQMLQAERQRVTTQKLDQEQYDLAMVDIQKGNYTQALDRLESIRRNEPNFPGLEEAKNKALAALNATPTPTPTITPIPSPTPDVAKVEQLINAAKQQFRDKEYSKMILTLLTLKVQYPGDEIQQVRVDDLLWVALRYNGVDILKNSNNLTQGMYYLDLAKNYAPLDKQANDLMNDAAKFLDAYQSAYWYRTKDIEKSLGYFEEAVLMRPFYRDNLLRDYVDVALEIGDQLMQAGHPCQAVQYYQKAVDAMPDNEKAVNALATATQGCIDTYPTPTSTELPTETPTTP